MPTTIGVFLPEAASLPSSNMPAPGVDGQQRAYLAFDAATDETCDWTFIAPQNISGTLTAICSYYMASATTGNIIVQAAVEAITDGDVVDLDSASSFDTANSSSATAVPGTQGYIDQVSITLTNADSIAAGDLVRLRLNRDADNASDTAAGDLHLLAVELRQSA